MNCALHPEKLLDKEVLIETEVANWTDYYCEECIKVKAKCNLINSWFYNTASKFPTEIKKELKNNPIEIFYLTEAGETKKLKHYGCYRYFDNNPIVIEIYQMWSSKDNDYRISICKYNDRYYKDLILDSSVKFSSLSLNDDYLRDIMENE